MPREHNFLLWRGEKLTSPAEIVSTGGKKNPPYDFRTARGRLATRLKTLTEQIQALPPDACPGDEAVALLTLHPRYVSKSDRPDVLLDAVGLRTIGSHARAVKPDRWGVKKHPESAISEQLYLAGPRAAFLRWAKDIPKWTEEAVGAQILRGLEDLVALDAHARIKEIPDTPNVTLEVVLHTRSQSDVVGSFARFAESCEATVLLNRRRDVGGLTFLPVRMPKSRVKDLAKFTFMRVVRGMPTLRPIRPNLLRSVSPAPIALPSQGPQDSSLRAVVFDGGIPYSARNALKPWVKLIEPSGIGPSVPDFEAHGLGVTTALLFGPIEPGMSLDQPFCWVDHVRVLDQNTGVDRDLQCPDVLDRILEYLDAHQGEYPLVNLSVGPSLPIQDDEVTAWTALLDARFAQGQCLVTVAVGNDGDRDDATGLNRIQPPSDGVNVLSVGASDKPGLGGRRALYSSIGPGRSPGLIKPDGLAFGGTEAQGFGILNGRLALVTDFGTSFASPSTLRSGTSVLSTLDSASMTPLTVRALMVHRAEREDKESVHPIREVGWGCFEMDPQRLITCEDNESLVVFRGDLPLGTFLRAPVPLPVETLQGDMHLTVTLLIAPEVDPEHPSSYTRAGLEVFFRPDSRAYSIDPKGKASRHPVTESFFSRKDLAYAPEHVLRGDGHKWEPCLKARRKLKPGDLHEPAFDIRYHHREGGVSAKNPRAIPYALIISVRAPNMPDFYNMVVRAHAQILLPVRPKILIPIPSKNAW
jgi:hypothetical protein